MSNGTNGDDNLTGTSGDDVLNAFDGNDVLEGLEGNDFLRGGGGDDTMIGGLGDDRYEVDSILDVVVEGLNEGIDRVDATISYRLGANIEQLVLQGSDDLDGFGNELDNRISGNSGDNTIYGYAGRDILYGFDGNDVLNGGEGRDFLLGGRGDDTYIIDDSQDRIRQEKSDADNGGRDKVVATVDFTLPDHVEILQFSGNDALNGTGGSTDNSLVGNGASNTLKGMGGNDTLRGNGGDDTLEGGSGEDILIGGAGADILTGGDGGDTYTVGDALDTITELSGDAGVDTIRSSVDITIADNVERLVLIGTATEATGNDDGQVIWGNGSDNIINALGGDDELLGKGGADTFVFAGADFGDNTILDFVDGTDIIDLSDTGFADLASLQGAGAILSNDVNGNGTIDLSGVVGLDGTITLTGVDVSLIDDTDFAF